jgi:mannose/fructose-specific phosphotransferase system component IIA
MNGPAERQRNVTGIVVTHGRLGEELLQTARLVFGEFGHCHAVSNVSMSRESLYEEIERLAELDPGVGCIIFVDFFGGSCSLPCMQFEMDREGVRVISGVNLPMLLAFLNKRDKVPFDRLPMEIAERGQNSIMILDPSKL